MSKLQKKLLTLAFSALIFSIADFSEGQEYSLNEALNILRLENRDLCSITDNDLRKSLFRLKNFFDQEELAQASKSISDARNNLCQNHQDPMSLATKITDKIYLGPHTVARNKDSLSKLGITAVISMTAECGIIFPQDNEIDYFYRGDKLVEHECTIEDIVEIIDDIYEFAKEKLNSRTDKLLVHCVQGKTRSATAVTYILAKRNKKSIKEVYDFIKSKRDINIPDAWLEILQKHLNETQFLNKN